MKLKCSFILKSSIALILTALMIFGSVSTVLAATVDMAEAGANTDLAASGWNNTTWYLGNDVAKVWDNSASNCTMTKSGTVKFYYDLYLKSTDADVYYRPYEKDNYPMGPTAGNNTKVTTTGNAGSGYNDGRCWYFDTADCTANKYNKIRIWIDTSGNNGNGWSWYEKTEISNISPTLTAPSTGTVGTAITLTGGSTDANKIGALTKTYQYSTNNGSTWTDLASGSYTATSAGTVKFRYKVSDAGVKTSGSGTNGRTARVEYSAEQSCTFSAATTTYDNIAVAAKGSTDGSTFNTTLSGTPATISANSYTTGSSALNISAGTVSGYSFYKWVVTSGSGTISNANTASTSFVPSASNTTVTARYKKSYTITKNTPTGGSVTLSKDSAVAGDSYTVTLTPNDGYKVKSLTLNGSAVTVSNNKYTGTASGTSDTLAFVATFEPNTSMKLYIAGRFRVRPSEGSSSWTTTYASGSDWNATSTNIPFTYLSGTTYKVDTYATLAELSADIGSSSYTGNPVFFVYDTTNSKNWYASSATTMNTSGTTLVSSGGANSNLKFSSTSTDGPVTIYYDSNTHKIWYTIPDLYNVTINPATGGTVTASPARAEADTEITLTIAPTTGYQLKSITAKDSSNASVTLSGTGNTRTFTMPAKNVTVTPEFEKITWSGLTAVGKYSTTAKDDASYSNDFPAGSVPNITIAATSATQLDGVAVTAPATDPTGYVFAGWYTANGSFTNPANKDTTFKPNAANAVAIAKYKKIFTITSSVDNTGTGAGTVTTSKTSVEAGGSYTITATAKSGSAIESVKVNGTAKTATASQTISGVSADQDVKVKFKSNVYLKGTMNSTAWAGDVMTANSDGTSYTIANVVLNAGTTYEFKHWVDSGGDGTYSTTVSNWALNNIATHSTKSDGYGGTNLTITPSVKAKVTFVSDGTKFTSITAIPYESTTYNVTLTQSADYTITSTYMGVEYITSGKNADVTVPVYSGTGFSYTVTPASGKYLSGVAQSNSVALSPAFSAKTHANSYTGTVSSVSKAFAVSATAASKLSVKAVTNKSARGTVSIDKTTAAPGETINITVTPLSGSFAALTATYANGAVYTYNLKNKNWSRTTEATQTAGASTGALSSIFVNPFSKADLAATGAEAEAVSTAATRELYPTGAASIIPMTLAESSAVTINATFDNYSGESTWYYNGYDTSGNAVSGYHSKQMTEGMINGEKFSYYHVEGRTSTDQLMTVSNGAASSGTRYVYFTASAEGGWSTDENHQYAYFYNGNGDAGNAFPGYKMSKYTTNDYGQNVYRVEIPTGSSPTGVIFNNAGNAAHQTTNVTDLSKGGYYLLNTSHWDSDKQKTVHDWQSYDCTYPSAGYSTGTEYFYGSGNDVSTIYSTDNNGKSIFGTTGFYRHGTNNKNYAKPRLTDSDKGDYYVNVLYPGKTYTINGVTKTIGTDPVVIWSKDPLAGDDENVKIYAKDGAIRAETFGSTYANIADTKIYAADGTTTVGTKHNGSIANQTYETYKAAKGDTLVIKTTIGATDSSTFSNAADLKAKYYVRGFCINGEVPALLEPTNDGVYTLTYKVPEDFEGKSIEITPIYYLKDTEANPIVTYRVTGFTDELKAVGAGKPGWGDTLYTYPFYGKLGGQNNAFGAYPGQPMVYYKGQYQMQIPVKSTAWDPYGETASTVNNTTVSGVTMSNGYWDSVHKQIMGYGDNSSSADHVQTYDYGDFYKIFNEKKPVDNIVFDFKYRTAKHNLTDIITTNTTASDLNTKYGTGGNGFELLTNFHGKNVDLFGTPLSGAAADPTQTTPVYVVSTGGVIDNTSGVENIAGYYATEWVVYGNTSGTTYQRISGGGKNSIPPEVLVLNNDDTTSFNTTTYPSADANHNVTDWKAMYTELKQYAGHPVMISYEAADAQQGQGMYYTGTGGATRNDGRWLYSKNGENITSTIRIDVSHDSGATYVENPASGETGHIDGLSAYFTNADAYQKMTYSTTIDPDKTFDFEAKTTNASYKFVGWYMEDGTKITSDNVSHTERSGSYTFVARFMEVSSGQLTLSHSVDTGEIVRVDGHDYTCNGSGSAKIGAVITDADTNEVLRTFDLSSSDITIPEKYIGNDKNYKITVTLEATADTNTAYGTSKLANTDASSVTEARFFNPKTPTTSGKTTTYTFTFNVKDDLYNGTTQRALALTYHSYFIQYKFNYQINYTFNDRNGETQQYKRIGTLTPGEANTYVKKVDSNRYLDKSFIEKMAPYESNFGQDITWNFEDYLISTGGEDGSNYEYAINAHYTATQTNLNKRNITFVLPYQHNNGVAVMTDGVGTKATTNNLELIAVTDQDGKITQDNRVDFNTIPVLPNNGVNGIFDEDGKKNWVAAPATITDGGSILNFQYWSVKPTDRAGENDPDVARCYFQGFNFVAYDNYIITPVYGASTVTPSDIGRNTNITYVETTRNQWNSNGTNYTKAQTSSAADLLYNDFIVAYNFDGKDIYNGDANADIAELGVVVERIQKLEIKDDGTYDTTLSRYTGIALDENGVNAAIASTTDIALSGKNKISKHAIAASELDNKNRIQFFNGIYNSAGWVQNDEGGVPAQNYGYKNYVYRAYSYMKLKNGTVIKSAVPAYFTMYDVATADAIDM